MKVDVIQEGFYAPVYRDLSLSLSYSSYAYYISYMYDFLQTDSLYHAIESVYYET